MQSSTYLPAAIFVMLKQLCLLSQAERRRKLGLPAEDPAPPKPSTPVVEEKKVFIYAIAALFTVLSHMDISGPTQT